jgi:hypothetical protein
MNLPFSLAPIKKPPSISPIDLEGVRKFWLPLRLCDCFRNGAFPFTIPAVAPDPPGNNANGNGQRSLDVTQRIKFSPFPELSLTVEQVLASGNLPESDGEALYPSEYGQIERIKGFEELQQPPCNERNAPRYI